MTINVEQLAKDCIKQGMSKAETLAKYKRAVIESETAQGRQTGSAYVLADAYDQAMKQRNIYTLYQHYKRQRAKGLSAIDALRKIRYAEKLLNQFGSYVSDGDTIDAIEGYTINLVIEHDCDNWQYSDIIDRKRGMNSQGYYCYPCDDKPDQVQRYKAGDGLTVYYRGYLAELPEKWIKQFYSPRLGRHRAYIDMIRRAQEAVECDIDCALSDYYTIGVVVTDSHGKEIYSDYLGGCDEKYAASGAAFVDHGMIESAKAAIVKDLVQWADQVMESRPDMYQFQPLLQSAADTFN